MKISIWKHSICGLVMIGLLAPVAMANPGTWEDPIAGWEAVYDATGGQLPWDLSGTGTAKTWTNQVPRDPSTLGFTSSDPNVANYAGIVTDVVSGQSSMYMKSSLGSGFAIAALQESPGSGTNSDLLTIDFKFRLFSDLPESTPYASLPTTLPLLLQIVRPPSTDQLAANPNVNEQFWQVRFRRQGLFVLGANSSGTSTTTNGTTQLSNDWHEMRVLVDLTTGAADFYMDGATTPDVADIYSRVNAIADPADVDNTIYFGTASSSVYGTASVEYVKITSSELAAVQHAGDANHDGIVNLADLQILGDNWQSTTATWAEADFTGDGVVNLADLQIIGDNWGYGTGSDLAFDEALARGGISIPEPASLVMLGPGGLLISRRRSMC